MPPLFKKLNLKDQRVVAVLNAPESFERELKALSTLTVLRRIDSGTEIDFGIAFAITQAQRDEASATLAAAARGDAVIWIAYPKSTSRRYRCEFNRDSSWAVLGDAGFEGVRQIAIDDDWSALRFRKVQFIKSLTRAPQRAMTRQGKARTSG